MKRQAKGFLWCVSTQQEPTHASGVIMEEIGHFPMCENPMQFKKYLMPVLGRILQAG